MKKYILLSHYLSPTTPVYGDASGIEVTSEKSLCNGDSCNTAFLKMPNHIGTHIDFPSHFCKKGKCSSDYDINDFIFKNIRVLDIEKIKNTNLEASDLSNFEGSNLVEFVLVKTGFEKFRNEQDYIFNAPVFTMGFIKKVFELFPNIKGIGVDTISISSFSNRSEGRLVHQFILCERNALIVEDVSLDSLKCDYLEELKVIPLLIQGIDGVPVTVMGLP